jgi:hypothetical protein
VSVGLFDGFCLRIDKVHHHRRGGETYRSGVVDSGFVTSHRLRDFCWPSTKSRDHKNQPAWLSQWRGLYPSLPVLLTAARFPDRFFKNATAMLAYLQTDTRTQAHVQTFEYRSGPSTIDQAKAPAHERNKHRRPRHKTATEHSCL